VTIKQFSEADHTCVSCNHTDRALRYTIPTTHFCKECRTPVSRALGLRHRRQYEHAEMCSLKRSPIESVLYSSATLGARLAWPVSAPDAYPNALPL